MMYTRPCASDYDDWKTVHKNPGWGSEDLIPLLKKVWYTPGLINYLANGCLLVADGDVPDRQGRSNARH